MNVLEFQKFLTKQKEYKGKVYSNAQLIALETFQKGFKSDLSKIEPLTQEQDQYYTKMILGKFIESNPKGNYRLTDEEKKCLSLLERTLKMDYGLTDSQVKRYWEHLIAERTKLEEYYIKKIDSFYHLSPIAPDKLHPCEETGDIGIDLKECQDAYHQMNGKFCYVAPKGVIPLCLRPTENKMYPYLNPSFVVVCTEEKDFEKSCLTCYEYEVEKSSAIRPIIMPWGNEPVEYISTRPLKITNLENPKVQTPETLTKDGLKIYLIGDYEYYKQLTQSPVLSSLPIEQQERYFENLVKNNPDKIKVYTPHSSDKQRNLNSALISQLKNPGNF